MTVMASIGPTGSADEGELGTDVTPPRRCVRSDHGERYRRPQTTPPRCRALRIKVLYGDNVIFITPDEVALMLASAGDAGNFIGTVKRLFPGSVVA
jgi:hypothetical protein